MASIKPSPRYSSFDSRSSVSSEFSDPSSSTEFKKPIKNQSPFKRIIGSSGSGQRAVDSISTAENSSWALVRKKSSDLNFAQAKNEQNLGSMVKRFVESRSKTKVSGDRMTLVIPADFVAENLKKNAAKGLKFSGFHRKLFQKGKSSTEQLAETKALTEVKSNTRTLAMVLRSERELLIQNKEYESEITELKLMMEEKSREAEKLKDLCLKQREEIKALKSAVLFPDVLNSQLQELLEKQGSELKQTKQVIPTLQEQVTSLKGQLQCLAEDLAEVKADKFAANASYGGGISSPRTPIFEQEATSSLYSFGDTTTPGSSDDMFLWDFNPCLTPYYAKSKSMDYDGMLDYGSLEEKDALPASTQVKVIGRTQCTRLPL